MGLLLDEAEAMVRQADETKAKKQDTG